MSAPAYCPHCGLNVLADETVERDGWIVDPRSSYVRVPDGRWVKVTKTQRTAFHTIAAARRSVSSEVVAARSSPTENRGSVTVLMHRLRRELAKHGLRPPFELVRGEGYIWTGDKA